VKVDVEIDFLDHRSRGQRRTVTVDLGSHATHVNGVAAVRVIRRDRVQVNFDGNPTRYCYLMDPDELEGLRLGDRVAVESPLTRRTEFPRIVGFDQDPAASKYARRLPANAIKMDIWEYGS
jgi:hypothetical protein